jgi:hypothetical protein
MSYHADNRESCVGRVGKPKQPKSECKYHVVVISKGSARGAVRAFAAAPRGNLRRLAERSSRGRVRSAWHGVYGERSAISSGRASELEGILSLVVGRDEATIRAYIRKQD